MDLGGVEGGEGNRFGWMGEGEEGSCSVGEERGKNTTGWMGETGDGEACFVGEEDGDLASLVGEEGEAGLLGGGDVVPGLVGDEGEGQETGVAAVVLVKRAGGSEGEGDV